MRAQRSSLLRFRCTGARGFHATRVPIRVKAILVTLVLLAGLALQPTALADDGGGNDGGLVGKLPKCEDVLGAPKCEEVRKDLEDLLTCTCPPL